MNRLLLIFLLMVLPLQSVWSAAAVYCQHEREKSARHVGHHTHQHQVQADSAEDQDNQFQVHSDCGYCHGVAQATLVTPLLPAMIPFGSIKVDPPPLSFSSHISDGPRRPDRHPVA